MTCGWSNPVALIAAHHQDVSPWTVTQFHEMEGAKMILPGAMSSTQTPCLAQISRLCQEFKPWTPFFFLIKI
jgi:hypothetical protein